MCTALLSVFLSGSAWWDLKTGKIPNFWIFLGAAGFITLKFIRGPSGTVGEFAAETGSFLFRITFFTAVFFVLFLFRMMGAGDIKVMALIGGYLGISKGFSVIFCGLAAASVWSFFTMIQKGIFKKRMYYFFNYVGRSMETRAVTPYYRAEQDGGEAGFCFVPFLWGGFLLWLAGQGGMG